MCVGEALKAAERMSKTQSYAVTSCLQKALTLPVYPTNLTSEPL